MQLVFEFQTKGVANARATRHVLPMATDSIKTAGLFSEVGDKPVPGGALLSITMRVPLGAPAATMDTIVAACASGIAPVALGEFRLAPDRPAALDLSVGARGNTFRRRDRRSRCT